SSGSSRQPVHPGLLQRGHEQGGHMYRPSPRLAAALLVLALGSVACVASAVAARSGGWTRVSGPTAPGEQLGLARTGDGVLHVIWNRGATSTSILETRFSAAGRPSGSSTDATGWNGIVGPVLLSIPVGTLRLFAACTSV